MDKTPVYKYPGDYARENGELEQYRASRQTNVACAKAIQNAINRYHEGFSFDSKAAVKDVRAQFGYDRILYVLAATVQAKIWDGRFSSANKNWAMTVPIFDKRSSEYVVQSHSTLTDAFVATARHEYLLTLPLTKEDIRAEALNILSKLQNEREPNSPNGTHYMAQVSPDFLARANSKDRSKLFSLLPFQSLALSELDGRKGIYALIAEDEDRNQSLRRGRSSVRTKLNDSPAPAPPKKPSKPRGPEL